MGIDIDDEPDEMDLNKKWEMEDRTYLNNADTVFESQMNKGINNRGSVFERQAVFHVSNREE